MKLPVVITLVFVVGFLLLVIIQPFIFHTYSLTIIDDGYYYLGYAQNIAQGNGPTFDGIVETNGVQPLWAVLLTALAILTPETISLVSVSMLAALVLVLISVFAMHQILSQFFSGHFHSFMMLLYLGMIANPSLVLSGMETSINLATFTLALWFTLRITKPDYTSTLLAGFFIGLSCLSRVDNLIITPIFALLMLWKTGFLEEIIERRTGFFKAWGWVMLLASPAVILFAFYLTFNLAVFDRLLPISGDIKAALHQNTLAQEGGRFALTSLITTTTDSLAQYGTILNTIFWMPLASFSPITLVIRIGVILLIVAAVISLIRSMPFRHRFPKISSVNRIILCASGMILFLHTWLLFFQTGKQNASFLNWYYVPEYIFLLIFMGMILKVCTQLIHIRTHIYHILMRGFIVSLGIGLLSFGVYFSNPPEVKPLTARYEVALWANQNLPADAITGSFNAGIVGYFTDMQVINLDGLMNNQDILDVAHGYRTIWDYIQAQHIDYIIDYVPSSWDLEKASDFKGIPVDDLDLIYSQPFTGYSFIPSVLYVFLVGQED